MEFCEIVMALLVDGLLGREVRCSSIVKLIDKLDGEQV